MIYSPDYIFTNTETESALRSAQPTQAEQLTREVLSDARHTGLRCGRQINNGSEWLFAYPDGSLEIRPRNFSSLPGFVRYDPAIHKTADPRWRVGGPSRSQRPSDLSTRPESQPNKAAYLRERFSGNFMSFDTIYEMGRGERISFDSKCRLHTENAIFCASHIDTAPLASVRAGSLFINGNSFYVARCFDTPASRGLVSDIRRGRIKGMSMGFAIDDWFIDDDGTKIASAATINHICAHPDPACPFTSIGVF